jgi:type VI secretion system protein ImpK
MRQEIANLVHPVFEHGLRLRDRLGRGEETSLEAEQAALLGLLLGDREARRHPDYGGDDPGAAPAGPGEEAAGPFLGARYALVCWLDELFILASPWGQRWNEYKLEGRLYGSNDRAWRFWDQARLAAVRSPDALEAYFVCVMLGFSGELEGDSEALSGWVAATRHQIQQATATGWRGVPGLELPTRVAPLSGRAGLRRMLLVASVVLLAVVPAVAWVLARRLM